MISATLNVHRMNSPPTERRKSFVKFEFKNMSNLYITKIEDNLSFHSTYEIIIKDPKNISITSKQKDEAYIQFKDFLLAINLSLTSGCITAKNFTFNNFKLQSKIDPIEPITKMVRNKSSTEINIEHGIKFDVTARNEITGIDTINEGNILDIFIKIQRFRNKINGMTHSKEMDIEKSLDSYTEGMESLSLIQKFHSLFESLELIANSDGKHRQGDVFDVNVSILTGIDAVEIGGWRDFNNRIKHINRGQEDFKVFIEGRDQITRLLPNIRQACTTIILSKM